LRCLSEQLPAVLWTTDGYLKFTSSCGAVLTKLGLRTDQIIGTSLYEHLGTEDPDCLPIASHLKALRGDSVAYTYEHQGVTYQSYLEPLRNEQNAIIGVVGLALDISSEVEASRQLELSQFTIDHSSNLIFWVNSDGRIDYINQQVCRSLKRARETVIGLPLSEIDPAMQGEGWKDLWQRCRQDGQITYEAEMNQADGAVVPIEILINYFDIQGREFCCLFGRDITLRRQMEDQLRLSQKMDALGRLAGGVAHDFNNQLSGIIVAAELIEKMDDVPKDVLHYVELILMAAQHSSEITQQLLAFARKGEGQAEQVPINHIIEEALQLLRLSVSSLVTIHQDLHAEELYVLGEASQLQNAFLNMGLNSRDAMPGGGELIISTRKKILSKPAIGDQGGAVDAGPCVVIEVRDTGHGMSEEVINNACDPFFTTKSAGQGTGLGLAAVRSIVLAHGGAMTIKSQPGNGTTISVILPLTIYQGEEVEQIVEEELGGHHGHILVADDNDMVRDITHDLLERMGYDVTLAYDSRNALDLFTEKPDVYNLVMLDMIMPRMSTPELVDEIRQIRQDCRILLISGYAMDQQVSDLLQRGGVDFIQKPFHLKALGDKVVSCLRD
jgi:PAS domain S-box-containing protein